MRDSLTLLHRGDFRMSMQGLELVSLLSTVEMGGSVNSTPDGCAGFMVDTIEFFIPLGDKIDHEAERAKINDEITYYEGLRTMILKKLNNPSFVNKAPANVVESEKKKLADTETKLAALRNRL